MSFPELADYSILNILPVAEIAGYLYSTSAGYQYVIIFSPFPSATLTYIYMSQFVLAISECWADFNEKPILFAARCKQNPVCFLKLRDSPPT